MEDSRWLISTLIPSDSKFFNDSTTESPIQNFIIIATDSAQMAIKYGYTNFSVYCTEHCKRQIAKGSNVSKIDTTELNGRKAYHWTSKVPRKGKDSLMQEQHLLQLANFYTSFLSTHSIAGKATDTKKILDSIIFK